MTDSVSEPTKRRRGFVLKTFARKRRRQQQMMRDSEGVSSMLAEGAADSLAATTATAVPHHTEDVNAVSSASIRVREPSSTTTATPPEAPLPTDNASSSSNVSLSSNESKRNYGNIDSDSSSSEVVVAATTRTKPKAKGWSCERCTLWNEMKNRRCTVCAARRPPADKLQKPASSATTAAAAKASHAGEAVFSANAEAAIVTTRKNETQISTGTCQMGTKAVERTPVADENMIKLRSTTATPTLSGISPKVSGSMSTQMTETPPSICSSSYRKKGATCTPHQHPEDNPSATNDTPTSKVKQHETVDNSIVQTPLEHEASVRDSSNTDNIDDTQPRFTHKTQAIANALPPMQESTIAPTKQDSNPNRCDGRLYRDSTNIPKNTDRTETSCLETKLDEMIRMFQVQENRNLRLQEEIGRVQKQNQRLENKIELLLQWQEEYDVRLHRFRDGTKSSTAGMAKVAARVSNVGANTRIMKSMESSLTVAPVDFAPNEVAPRTAPSCAKTRQEICQDHEPREMSDKSIQPATKPSNSISLPEKVPVPASNSEDSQPTLDCPSPTASTPTVDPDPSSASAAKTLDFSHRSRKAPLGGPRLDFVSTAATRLNHNLEPSYSQLRAHLAPTHNNGSTDTKPFQPLKNSTNAITKQPPASAGADGWISNKPTRQFLREMDAGAVPANTEGKSEWLEARSTRHTNKAGTTTKNLLAPGSRPGRDALWEESQEPGYAYKETVRCKAVRAGLPCHDCEQCRKFYQTLRDTGHDLSQDPINFSRHRSRFSPSETPVDFWELDFIDERDAERQRRQSEGQP